MNVLLSAFFCEPGRGGEFGAGWRWANEIAALGHEVLVLTRAASRPAVEAGTDGMPLPRNLRLVYYELPAVPRACVGYNASWRLHYLLWQYGAYRYARLLHQEHRFDLVHHITMSDVKHPTFMGGLGIPLILGPLGGGEQAPIRLRHGYGLRGWTSDLIRDLAVLLLPFVDPFLRQSFREATRIYVRTPDTLQFIPARYRSKADILFGIGTDTLEETGAPSDRSVLDPDFRILYVGRLIHWKGVHLVLQAFARLLAVRPDARLTVVGRGSQQERLQRLADSLGIASKLVWVTRWMSDEELAEFYRTHHVLLFPSLHEAGGTVVLEALAHGLPVVCLRLGGPGYLVDQSCGRAVEVLHRTVEEVVRDLAAAVLEIASDPRLRDSLAKGASTRAGQYSWRNTVRSVYLDAAGQLQPPR